MSFQRVVPAANVETPTTDVNNLKIVFDRTTARIGRCGDANRRNNMTWCEQLAQKLSSGCAPGALIECSVFLNSLNDQLSPTATCCCVANINRLKIVTANASTQMYRIRNVNGCNTSAVYFFDLVNIVKRSNSCGNYLSVTWPGLHKLNALYAKPMKLQLSDNLVLQERIFVAMPSNRDASSVAAATVFARKFFHVDASLNREVICTGVLAHRKIQISPVNVTALYESVLMENRRVRAIMGAIVDGVKQNNSKPLVLHTLNNKGSSEVKTFSLIVKPMIFIRV
nr:DBP-2 [Calliteara abietis nucleopolyhedrovirus]